MFADVLICTVLFKPKHLQLATLFMMYKQEDVKSVMITKLKVKKQFGCYSLLELHT